MAGTPGGGPPGPGGDGEAPARLRRNLEALTRLLERPGFGLGAPTIGAELELFIVDGDGLPLQRNSQLCRDLGDHRFTVELLRHTIELNLTPVALAGRPFSRLAAEAGDLRARAERAAAAYGGRLVAVGIPPTVRLTDLGPGALTDTPRLRRLSEGMHRLRPDPLLPFPVEIAGPEPAKLTCDHMFLAGSSAACQVHLRVDPDRYVPTYNAARVASAAGLAVAGNSPIFLGNLLWEETRIELLEQALNPFKAVPDGPGRIGFGAGWAQGGADGLFAENVRHHPPVLPLDGGEDPLEALERGLVPRLDELRLHNGTIWPWNRAVFDAGAADGSRGGHLRIEMRALPAGPTVRDETANAALLIGLTLALAPQADAWPATLPFEPVRRSFYAAARHGLDASLAWPSPEGGFEHAPASELLPRLLPAAAAALRQAGVDPAEVDEHLGVIAERARTRRTGAAWQRRAVTLLTPSLGRTAALAAMLDRYAELAGSGLLVHEWPDVDPP